MKRRRQPSRRATLTTSEKAGIDKCVEHFEANAHLFQSAAEAVVSACINDPDLTAFIHFIKHRLKDPTRLREKLRKKALQDKQNGRGPTISQANLFQKVNDLV
jgi:ppGpp synthetase/RelA/SpoT-type nucleotidyltranferase